MVGTASSSHTTIAQTDLHEIVPRNTKAIHTTIPELVPGQHRTYQRILRKGS